MICKYCQREIPDGSKFCPECGSRQSDPACINCGTPIFPDAKFCPNCGRPTSPQNVSPHQGPPAQNRPDPQWNAPEWNTPTQNQASYPPYRSAYQVPVQKKTPFYKKLWFWIGILFVLIVILASTADSGSPPESRLSESEYKAMCQSISYEELARNPGAKKGQYFKFTGEVIQVLEGPGSIINLRVNVTPVYLFDQISYYEDTIYVITKLGSDGRRILEGDKITLYGICTGLYTYESIFGATISIPGLEAGYWEIVN